LNNKINIVIVDDFRAYRQGLSAALSASGYRVLFECSNGLELREDLDPKQLPDIVIMDLDLPDAGGFMSTCWLKERYPTIRVLGVSMINLEIPIIRILYFGANGFLLKVATTDQFDEALKSIVRSDHYYSDLVPRKLIISIEKFKTMVNLNKQSFLHLSETEMKISKLVCGGLTNRQIAYELDSRANTIDQCIRGICRKLGVKDRLGLLLYVVKFDLLDFDGAILAALRANIKYNLSRD